ncbi:cellulose synthase operon protein YhjQ/BcsQ [Alcaligenaceae bacterium CGII-47]|nr:cellulose synthase operon protein YhjQ/BcsQ [Alcaligenaceae bacterium CGII-47]
MRVAMWGLKGGVGTTSLVAMLGDALSQLGESVLLIDLNPSDVLRLHFGIPYSDACGWALTHATEGDAWSGQAYHIKDELFVLPYGRHGNVPTTMRRSSLEGEAFWARAVERLGNEYSWVIFDLPSGGEDYLALRQPGALDVMVARPDIVSDVLLVQCPLMPGTRLLVNQHEPMYRLESDVLLSWQHHYGSRILPVRIGQDESIHEALGHKMPATSYLPASAGAHDMLSLATWCIAQRGVQS